MPEFHSRLENSDRGSYAWHLIALLSIALTILGIAQIIIQMPGPGEQATGQGVLMLYAAIVILLLVLPTLFFLRIRIRYISVILASAPFILLMITFAAVLTPFLVASLADFVLVAYFLGEGTAKSK